MPGPTTTLGFIISTLFGAAFHMLVGGDAQKLAVYLLAGWLGFTIGHILGVVFEFQLLSIGPLRALPAMVGALAALGAAFAMVRRKK